MGLVLAVVAVPLALIVVVVVAVLMSRINRARSPRATACRVVAWLAGLAVVLALVDGALMYNGGRTDPWLAPLKASVMADSTVVTNVSVESGWNVFADPSVLVLRVSCDPGITDDQADAVVGDIKRYLVDGQGANDVGLVTSGTVDAGFDYMYNTISVELLSNTDKRLILEYQSAAYRTDSADASSEVSLDNYTTWTVTGGAQTRTLTVP
jgi:hypothetical protein